MPGQLPNAKAFAKPKSHTKGALIIDMRTINARCANTTPKFHLPTLDQLKALLTQNRTLPIFFCKLDISNHFWTCKLPPSAAHQIRIGVGGTTYSLMSLPFGWKCSPAIAQLLLGSFLAHHHHPSVVSLQYLDDILLFSTSDTALHIHTLDLVTSLTHHGWIFSSKSATLPSPAVTWMGKCLDGSMRTIANQGSYLASIVVQWLLLSTQGYSATRLRRLLGKLNWAVRPSIGAHPFLAGAYLWLHKGPRASHFTPARVLRGLAEAIAFSLYPWKARSAVSPRQLWFTDASFDGTAYWISLWSPHIGIRIYRAPTWVNSQQSAELLALVTAARIAAFRGLPSLALAVDNMAAIHSALHCRAPPAAKPRTRLLRQLQHTLRWSGLTLHLHWVRGSLNPADPSSRWYSYPSPHIMLGRTLGRHVALSLSLPWVAPLIGVTSAHS